MPIFTKCNFESALDFRKNNPVNLSLCYMVTKSEEWNRNDDGDVVSIIPSISFVMRGMTHQWFFESEQARDSEFERILSV